MTEDKCSANRPAKMLKIEWNELVPLRNELKHLADKYNASMAQICLNWSVQHGVLPLVGCRTPTQARDSVQAVAGTWNLTKEEVEILDNVALDRSTFRSSNRKRMFFVTLFGIVMVVCNTMDWLGFGMVAEAGKLL
jgi:diketogulonate reductase-like aldo/keto reductase